MTSTNQIICRRLFSPTVARNASFSSAAVSGHEGSSGGTGAGGSGGGGAKLWKKLTFFVALPALGLAMANAYLKHEEQERPEFVPYEYMRIRHKRFPWGDGKRSFFHNPHNNPLPDGYEN
ncbi:cytochrome c oxidase subunit 6A1, mitochondrial-like [Malaya genurostris]|uniref:cytochrome c oxidase subunit 6A1, mitochondrial-like n=1 Tax=Malaya genurostris TaxID=325434 RepID=UPI0026F3B10F|nr:cytochrome c oxidase subunit 6A1, mitochondrial-like [Malaya genurostris]